MALLTDRCRNWTFVGYPEESLKSDYRNILRNNHLMWVESPVHDDDSHGDGTKKKKHIHFILVFEGNKSKDQIYEIMQQIMDCPPPPQPVKNMTGMIRYLIHLDDPDKAQYDKRDIYTYGGIDLETYFMPTKNQQTDELQLIIQYCESQDIKSYRQFLLNMMSIGNKDWFYIATSTNTFALSSYFSSKRQENIDKFQNGGGN